jgi:hypothetical protein
VQIKKQTRKGIKHASTQFVVKHVSANFPQFKGMVQSLQISIITGVAL